MNRYPWFRLYSEARTDAKLRTLTDSQFRVWFNLLCYASEQDERGTIPPTNAFLLAVEVAGGDEDALAQTLSRLVALRMVEIADDDAITFSKFVARQYDKPSDSPEATRERKARQRAKERDARVTTDESRPMSRDVTPSHAPEKSRVEEIRKEERKGERVERAARATPAPDVFPITDEMRDWAATNAPDVDIERETARFLDRNRAQGTTYKDWRAAWRNWLTSPYAKAPARPTGRAPNHRPTVEEKNFALLQRIIDQENGHDQGAFPDAIDVDCHGDEQGSHPRPLRPVVAEVRRAPR